MHPQVLKIEFTVAHLKVRAIFLDNNFVVIMNIDIIVKSNLNKEVYII